MNGVNKPYECSLTTAMTTHSIFFFEKNFIATTKLHKQTYLLFTVLNGVVGVIINQTIDLVINQVTDRE